MKTIKTKIKKVLLSIGRVGFEILNPKIFPISVNSDTGFFAQLNWCAYILSYCEEVKKSPAIQLTSRLYTIQPGDNFLDYFFDHSQLSERQTLRAKTWKRLSHRARHIKEFPKISDQRIGMTLEKANHLFSSNFTLKPDLAAYVEQFVESHFERGKTLGVHFRGTDKKEEAARVDWESAANTVSEYLLQNPETEVLFISSDESSFIEWLSNKFSSELKVVFHDDKEKSVSGKPIHLNASEGCAYTKGREALVNCLLLSRCDFLIRSASFLSGWASVFNPDMGVTMLNKPYDSKLWFPDSKVSEKSEERYLRPA